MSERTAGELTRAIAQELVACRQRGIERLNVKTHNQDPVRMPELQRLADDYMTATRRSGDRITQLKNLLRDALAVFTTENEGNKAAGELIFALFFGNSRSIVTENAGELLDAAMGKFKYPSEARFRQARGNAFGKFADFLPGFVASINSQDSEDKAIKAVTDRYRDHGEHYITLLSKAESVTIVDFPDESLASRLWQALRRKRATTVGSDVYWKSIRVVFLSDDLLDWIDDDHIYATADEARVRRRSVADSGHRKIVAFLQNLSNTRWKTYKSPHLQSISTLFKLPNGQYILDQITRRQWDTSDHFYLVLSDSEADYFSERFDEIVRDCVPDPKMILAAGTVEKERFKVGDMRYRQNVLKDGSQPRGFLAVVLVITWWIRNGRVEPLLQLRTELNASRELDRVTHPASHITQDDSTSMRPEFGAHDKIPMDAARRRTQMETGAVDPGELESLGTCRYLHRDKEHLFFFIYSCQLPEGFQLWRPEDMSAMSLHELLSIRENQVFRKALSLCESPPARRGIRADAFEIVALNLILHGYDDIAQRLTDAGLGKANLDEIMTDISELEIRTRRTWPRFDDEVELMGLAGLQFREFFGILLPFYKLIGVPGAAEQLMINHEPIKRQARLRLSELYHDEEIMKSIPPELEL